MALKNIDDLDPATLPLAGTEELEIVQGGINKRAPASAVGGASAFADLTDVDVSTPPTDGQVPVWDDGASKWVPGDQTGSGGGSGGGMTLLGYAVAVGGEASLSVTGIPATHKHLKVITSLQGSVNSANCAVRFNNDSSANAYDRVRSYGGSGTGTSTLKSNSLEDIVSSAGTFSGAHLGNFALGELDIPFYTETDRWKECTGLSGAQDGGSIDSLYVQMARGRWRNTAAINRIDVIPSSGTFNAGSTVEVWGIDEASGGGGSAAWSTKIVFDGTQSSYTINDVELQDYDTLEVELVGRSSLSGSLQSVNITANAVTAGYYWRRFFNGTQTEATAQTSIADLFFINGATVTDPDQMAYNVAQIVNCKGTSYKGMKASSLGANGTSGGTFWVEGFGRIPVNAPLTALTFSVASGAVFNEGHIIVRGK